MSVWVVLAQHGSGSSYTETFRGEATGWFDAVEKVDAESRTTEMFAARLDDIHLVHLIAGQAELPDAEVVKVQADGSLKRVRAVDPSPDG